MLTIPSINWVTSQQNPYTYKRTLAFIKSKLTTTKQNIIEISNSMDLEQVLNLFDFFWFERKISNKCPVTSKEIVDAESRRRLRGRRMRGCENRSHLELEFEELKGFMDLGFVFSEEDKGSSLASIVPGLNRLGKREEEEEERKSYGEISRPYLSKAWEDMEEEDQEEELRKPLMMKLWKFPSNQIHMKVHLKWWAHVVASTVR